MPSSGSNNNLSLYSGGRSGGGSKGGSDTIISTATGVEAPHGLLDFISDLEYKYTLEMRGAGEALVEGLFTQKDKLVAMEVGFRQTFMSGLITALMTPIAIGVVEKMIPVFGSTSPTMMDQLFVFLLTLSYMIGYAYFLGYASTCFFGGYTQSMVKSMLTGVISSAILKAIIAFLLFNFIYIKVFTEENILWLLKQLKIIPYLRPYLYSWYIWLVDFRSVFPLSAIFVVATTAIFCSIILGCYFWALKRNKRTRENDLANITI